MSEAIKHPLRGSLPPLPDRIKKLPVDERGYPVPFFVEWVNDKPDFRIMDGRKMHACVAKHLCWVCGQRLGYHLAFSVGPMCAINRVSAEPPSHRECAEFAARTCPFMLLPKAIRRDANIPAAATEPAGVMLKRNPGVFMVWMTKSYQIKDQLFRIGPAKEIMFFAEGRKAKHDEILESVASGLPLLMQPAIEQDAEDYREGRHSMRALEDEVTVALPKLGLTWRELLDAMPIDSASLIDQVRVLR